MTSTIKKHEMSARPKTVLKFKSRIVKGNPNECWTWQGVKNPDNYGYMRQCNMENGRIESYINIFVHRLSYYLAYGEIPNGSVIDHTCHNPKLCDGGVECEHRCCINPSHLKLSTPIENRVRSVMTNSFTGMCRNDIHPWVDENIKTWSNGKTVCLPCHQETTRRNAKKVGK